MRERASRAESCGWCGQAGRFVYWWESDARAAGPRAVVELGGRSARSGAGGLTSRRRRTGAAEPIRRPGPLLLAGEWNGEVVYYYGDDDDLGARQEADEQMAALEDAGRRATRARRLVKALRLEGNYPKAASYCPHGWGYGTPGEAAVQRADPRAGQIGWRCLDCGSFLDREPYGGGAVVLHPCELGSGS